MIIMGATEDFRSSTNPIKRNTFSSQSILSSTALFVERSLAHGTPHTPIFTPSLLHRLER